MPAAPAIGVVGSVLGAASAATSLFSGISGAGAAGDMAEAQAGAANAQTALAKAQWARYLEAFAPLENQMIQEAQTPARETPGFLSMMGGINRNYADQGANIRRMMGGRYQYGGGLETSAQASNELNRTKAVAGAEADWNNQRWSRMMGIAGYGRGLPSQAMAGYGSAAGTYGNLANMYGNASQQAFGGVGQGLGNLAQLSLLSGNSGGSLIPNWGAGMMPTLYQPGGNGWS